MMSTLRTAVKVNTLYLNTDKFNSGSSDLIWRKQNLETHLFKLLKKFIETRRFKKLAQLPEEYVSIDILAASLLGIIMWWIKDGIHFSSEYIADQIHLLYRR